MKPQNFIFLFLVAYIATIIPSCSENEPSNTMAVTKVGNYFQDTQGLHYRIKGNGVIVTRDMFDHGYQHLANSVNIPASIKYEKETYQVIGVEERVFEYNTTLDSVFVSPMNQYLSDQNGILYNKDCSQLIYYPCKRKGFSFVIPPTVKSIGKYAFARNERLISIDFSNSVTELGREAFWGCEYLSEIMNYESLELLDTACFAYTNVTTIYLPNVKTMRMAFAGCDQLQEIHLGSKINSITDDCLCINNSFMGCITGLKSYIIEAVTPPNVIQGESGSMRYREEYEPTLYVPSESIDQYKIVMGTYFSKIEPIP